MKICWVFPSFEIGGAQRRFAALAERFGPAFTHTIVDLAGGYQAADLIDPSVAWSRAPVTVDVSRFFSSKNIARYADILASQRPDLLVTHNWGSIEWRAANRRVKVPHVHIEDGFGADEAASRNFRRDAARRLLFSRIGTGHRRYGFIAPSQRIARLFRNDWEAPGDRVHYIANGVDIDTFGRGADERSVGASDDQAGTIVSIGALRREKRVDRLLCVFSVIRKLRPVRLVIVGDGPERAALEALSQSLGLTDDVDFVGARGDVSSFLWEADLFALASDTEQAPLCVIEAMSAGLAIVSTDVGDIKTMLAAENRDHVHTPADEEALAKSMLALLDDHAARRAIGLANRVRASREFSLEQMAARYRDVFGSLVAQAGVRKNASNIKTLQSA